MYMCFRLHDGSYIQVKDEIKIEENQLRENGHFGGLEADDHHTSSSKRFKRTVFRCKVCSEACSDLVQLNNHFKTHSAKLEFCKICHKTVNTKDNLTWHKHKQLLQSTKKQYGCPDCDEKFDFDSKLKSHLVVHSDERPYECNYCDLRLKRKDQLRRHVNAHSKNAPNLLHQCKDCHKVFTLFVDLNEHQRVHTGPFECDFCKQIFNRKQDLLDHRNLHRKKMQFRCEICKKTFSYRLTLLNHLKCHKNGRPHACDKCPLKYKTRNSLTRHKESTHKKDGTTEGLPTLVVP